MTCKVAIIAVVLDPPHQAVDFADGERFARLLVYEPDADGRKWTAYAKGDAFDDAMDAQEGDRVKILGAPKFKIETAASGEARMILNVKADKIEVLG